jgi:hypothetical protein
VNLADDLVDTKEFTFTISLALDEIDWEKVLYLLIEEKYFQASKARKLIISFVNRFESLFETSWFWGSELKGDYRDLLGTIFEIHGADAVTIHKQHSLRLTDSFNLSHRLEVKFSRETTAPSERQDDNIANKARIRITMGDNGIALRNSAAVIMARILQVFCGVSVYVLILGGALYSISVFLISQKASLSVIEQSFERPILGVALLLAFIMLAASIRVTFLFMGKMTLALLKKR